MKKLLKLFIFIFICFMPFIVDAETKLSYDWKVEDLYYITSVDGKYYFYDNRDDYYVNIFDKDGNFLVNKNSGFEDVENIADIYNNKLYSMMMYLDEFQIKYNSKLNKYYTTYLYNGEVYLFNDKPNLEPIMYEFDNPEHEDVIKELIGKEYDIYTDLTSKGLFPVIIAYEEGHYISYSVNENTSMWIKVFNENLEMIFEKKFEEFFLPPLKIYNNKIYIVDEEAVLNIYDLKGNVLFTRNLYLDMNEIYKDHYLYPCRIDVEHNNLVIQFEHYLNEPTGMKARSFDRNNIFDMGREIVSTYVTVKFKIESDIEFVNSNNGEAIGEKKIDEFDREYVELRIEPKAGYIVDEIIVTDAYGNRIEVNDNKFYMPSTDVKVEVKYKGGEYLPIPNTALSQNISFILIGILLIGLGMYTMNFIKREEN